LAEEGQRDDNVILPTYSHKNNTSPDWRRERTRIINFLCTQIMETMTKEERDRRVRNSIVERYFYEPDHRLVDAYDRLGGEWTDVLEDYRPKSVDPTTIK
jgi:hypothetical protein